MDCVAANQEASAIKKAYGFDDTTDTSVIERKAITYMTFHFAKVNGWIK